MKLFISYASEDKNKFLDSSVKLALEQERIEYWIDEDKIENGDNIPETIRENIQHCQACLLFVTPNSIKSPWCALEIGAFWSAGKKLFLYRKDEGITEEDLPSYLKNFNLRGTGQEIANKIKKEFERLKAPDKLIDEVRTLRSKTSFYNFFNTSTFRQSRAMSEVTLKYIQEIGQNINEIKSSTGQLSVPATDYPKYLIKLQEIDNARVKAVALVDEIERFWDEDIGYEILHVSKPEKTQRVFVFKKQRDFNRLEKIIEDHSLQYEVRLISEDNVRYHLNKKIYDFSLIWFSDKEFSEIEEPPPGVILAYYKTVHGYDEIEFTLDPAKVKTHWRRYQEVFAQASKPEKNRFNNNLDMKLTEKKIFGIERKEMSYYIPNIDKYDQCERLHPYFEEMRKTMLNTLTDYASRKSNSLIKILEFGAGTGILSGDILQCIKDNNIKGKLLSMEYDELYATYLTRKYDETDPNFTALQEDAKEYDPPGKFDFIFSSFADHHIIRTEEDAQKYYFNVRINLHANSTFIVGDEFLPQHNHNDLTQRINAIKKYHEHILETAEIEMAKSNMEEKKLYKGLIELETEAMNSGILAVTDPSSPHSGDFKVSISHFKKRIKQNGLCIKSIKKIGPQDESISDAVGGIYVMEIKLDET